MVRPFRLNSESVKHSGLADRKVADVDHLLHFAFAFGENFAGLAGNQLTEFVLQLAQRVSEAANCVASNGTGSLSPFLECLLRARDRLVIIVVACLANAG